MASLRNSGQQGGTEMIYVAEIANKDNERATKEYEVRSLKILLGW
jgi:hypothetical protein